MLAELLEKVLDPADEDKFVRQKATPTPALRRTDSDGSFASAVSSLGSANQAFIGRKKNAAAVAAAAAAAANASNLGRDKKPAIPSNIVQLDLSFNIDTVKIDIEKNQTTIFR